MLHQRPLFRRPLTVTSALLVLCLWAFSVLHFGGRSGKWLDDYSLSMRDPATGTYTLPVWYWNVPPFCSRPFFYRPLHLIWMYNGHTVLWNEDRPLHLINAFCHLGVVLLLWRLLGHLTRSPRVAIAGALLFAVFPLNYEVVFWPSALSGGISTAAILLLFNAYHRVVRGPNGGRFLVLMVTLAFLIPCWNEQPATGVGALPLLYLAFRCRPDSPRKRFVVVAPWLLCCLACLVYIGLVQATAPEIVRGSKGSMVHPAAATERILYVAGEVRQKLFGPWIAGIVEGGIRLGWRRVPAASMIPWTILLAMVCACWWKTWTACDAAPTHGPPRTSAHPMWTVLFGLTSFALSWVPIVAVRGQNVEARTCYYPAITLVVAFAGLADMVVARMAPRGWIAGLGRQAAGIALLFVCLACGLSLVGIQDCYRRRYTMDQGEMAQLRQLVPTPATQTVFVPLAMENRPVETGVGIFDHFAVPALGTPWSAEALVRQAYGRSDVTGTCFGWWVGRAPLSEFDANGFCYEPTGTRVEWSRAVPFVIDREGVVHLIDTVSIGPPGGGHLTVPLPHVRKLTEQSGLPEHSFAINAGGQE